jgi:hypothetical protein
VDELVGGALETHVVDKAQAVDGLDEASFAIRWQSYE